MLHVVLVEPEIPGNAGNIARVCAASQSRLHLVKPLGFSLDDKYLKRAGLDYWHLLDIEHHENFAAVPRKYPGHTFYYNSTKAKQPYTAVKFSPGDFLVFGKETAGLPAALLEANPEHAIRIPMIENARSINLSSAVAIVLYEALRQQNFEGLV